MLIPIELCGCHRGSKRRCFEMMGFQVDVEREEKGQEQPLGEGRAELE